MRKGLIPSAALAALVASSALAAPRHETGTLANGATYVIDVPEAWNGTLLLFSHGYARGPANPAQNAPGEAVKPQLLAKGYALAGSSFASTGWALEDAVPDQLATLDAFTAAVGKPKHTLAWGSSMGGLATMALIEGHPERFDGALPMCGSVGGAVAMMNSAFDAAFAFKTLLAPDLKLVAGVDDRAVAERAGVVVAQARQTPEGRARLALVAALAQLPGATLDEQLKSFVMGVFFPRADQERRAGGVFSWNTGVDYQRQVKTSGRRKALAAAYASAGLDLDQDLAALNAAPRQTADPKAVAYLTAHYVTTGALSRPVLSLHTTDDPLTSSANEGTYAAKVAARGKGKLLRQVFVARTGHCTFQPEEMVAAVDLLEGRVETGAWNAPPRAPFVAFRPERLLRP
ncbi:alpha/beta hydrolase [soil metagenome]